jgi:DNA-binding response OmpR family regulator
LTIIVVEDDNALSGLLGDLLRTEGYSVLTVGLAELAIDVLRSIRFDLMILDLGMPRGTMDGMELLARIREGEDWKSLPVIIMSGYGDLINRDVTDRLGVAAILSKPMQTLEDLLAAVKRIIGPETKSV